MTHVIPLLFRRLRAPLVVLITTYAVATLGLVLIPGEKPGGEPWRMDFFHAFYFITYTSTTIGFGELPHAFNGMQRLWTLFAIYATVLAWFYMAMALVALLLDPAFRQAVNVTGFHRSVRRIAEPFYIVCGYGENGALLTRALTDQGLRTVVLDRDQERIDALKVEGLPLEVPGLCADATKPDALIQAGLENWRCAGVIAVSPWDEDNLSIAVATKLLAPNTPVLCRVLHQETEANLASFGTDHIINPFRTFANRFATAVRSPSMYLIYAWLTGLEHQPREERVTPPRGTWILCGYGRFGKAMRHRLSQEGVKPVIIEADPGKAQPPVGAVEGRATEAETLREAGVEDADGLIAGTDNDANNLSILMTARAINPDLFTVARQCRSHNEPLYQAADVDLALDAGTVMSREVLALINTELLHELLELTLDQDETWAGALAARIRAVAGDTLPTTWSLQIDNHEAPAVLDAIAEVGFAHLVHLLSDPRDRSKWLPAVPLLLKRGSEHTLLPDPDATLETGDRLLFCGRKEAEQVMAWTAEDYNLYAYIRTGEERPQGLLWDWLAGYCKGDSA